MISILAFVAAGPAPITLVRAHGARCEIASVGEKSWSGTCLFAPEKGGSFTILPVGRERFPGDDQSLSVSVVATGGAGVRGPAHDGHPSRCGGAERTKPDTRFRAG